MRRVVAAGLHFSLLWSQKFQKRPLNHSGATSHANRGA
jgi:hypothetical protein